MARQVQVGGITTGIPGVRQNSIQRVNGSEPGILESGVVAILGTCEGTIQPDTVMEYRGGVNATLKAELVKGDLYDAARMAFDPSRNDKQEVRGASKVLAIRVNAATQATLDLEDGAGNDLLNMTTRAYGVAANGVAATVAAGASGAYGKKLTISRWGFNDEEKDDLGFLPVIAVRYKGAASGPATMTITDTTFATTITGSSPGGSEDLNLSFSTYDTVQKLADYVNGYKGNGGAQVYEMVIVTPKPTEYLCENLDFVTGADILTKVSASVEIAKSATNWTSGAPAGLTAGEIVKLTKAGQTDEYLYATTPTALIRGYMDTVDQLWNAVTTSTAGVTFRGITGVNQAIIEWCNGFSQHVTAARATGATTGTPDTTGQTYMSGGAEGASTSTEWQAALDTLRDHRVNFIVLTSTDAAIHALLKTHMDWRWGVDGSSEALAHVGAATLETKSQLKARAKALQSPNIALWGQDCKRGNDVGTSTQYAPWAMAAMAAGMQAGMGFGEGLHYKTFNVTELIQNSAIDLITDGEDFVEYGVSFARFYDGENRCVRCLTTWSQNDDHEKIEVNVRNSLAWVLYKIRDRVKFFHAGKAARRGNALAVKSTIRTALEDCRDSDGAIVEGSELVNGKREAIPAFNILPIEQSGNVIGFGYECVPTGSSDFLNGDTFVGEFQDVA